LRNQEIALEKHRLSEESVGQFMTKRAGREARFRPVERGRDRTSNQKKDEKVRKGALDGINTTRRLERARNVFLGT